MSSRRPVATELVDGLDRLGGRRPARPARARMTRTRTAFDALGRRAAAQHDRVARAQREGGDVDRHVRARLVDRRRPRRTARDTCCRAAHRSELRARRAPARPGRAARRRRAPPLRAPRPARRRGGDGHAAPTDAVAPPRSRSSRVRGDDRAACGDRARRRWRRARASCCAASSSRPIDAGCVLRQQHPLERAWWRVVGHPPSLATCRRQPGRAHRDRVSGRRRVDGSARTRCRSRSREGLATGRRW